MNGDEKRELVREHMVDMNPDAVFFDGLDDAIVGWATQFSNPPLVVYDFDEIIDILMSDGDTTEEEARDHFGYNIEGTWAGEGTPLILFRIAGGEEGGSVLVPGVQDMPERDGAEGVVPVQAVQPEEPRMGTL